jgi:hypothetical protein
MCSGTCTTGKFFNRKKYQYAFSLLSAISLFSILKTAPASESQLFWDSNSAKNYGFFRIRIHNTGMDESRYDSTDPGRLYLGTWVSAAAFAPKVSSIVDSKGT